MSTKQGSQPRKTDDEITQIIIREGLYERVTLKAGLGKGELQQHLINRTSELRALCVPVNDEMANAPFDEEAGTVEIAVWAQELFFQMRELIDEIEMLAELAQKTEGKANGGAS